VNEENELDKEEEEMKNEKINYWKVLSGFIILLVISWSVAALMIGFGVWAMALFTQLPWWGHIMMILNGLLIIYPPLYKHCQEEGNQ